MSSLFQGLTFIHRSDDDEKRVKKKEKKEKKKKRVKKHKKKRRTRSSDRDDDEATNEETRALRAQVRDEESCRRSTLASVPRNGVRGVPASKTSQKEIIAGRLDVAGRVDGLYEPMKLDPVSSTIGDEKEGEGRRRESERIVCGDGGASWRAKMLTRAEEKARGSGVAVEAIVQARFGAIETLKEQAKGCADGDAHLKYQRQGTGRKDGTARPTRDTAVLVRYSRRIERSVLDVEKREDGGRGEKEGNLVSRQKQKEEEDESIDKVLGSIGHEAKASASVRENRKDDYSDDTRKRVYPDRRHSRSREGSVDAKRGRRWDGRSRSWHRQVEDRCHSAEPVDSLVTQDESSIRRTRDEAKIAVEKLAAVNRNAFLYGHAKTVVAKVPTPSRAFSVEQAQENDSPRAILARSLPGTSTSVVVNEKATLNKLAAKALRAQMMGKTALFHTLTEQLNELEAKLEREKRAVSHDDASPGALPPLEKEDLRYGSRKGKKKRLSGLEGNGANVEASVEELVREERMASTRGNMDEIYARNIFRLGARFKGSEAKPLRLSSGVDEEEQVDTHLVQEAGAALTRRARHQRDHVLATNATKRWDDRMHACSLCMQSRGFQHHLMLSLGAFTYLALPPHRPFHAGHCVIVPIAHVCSMVQADEHVRNELKQFQAALTHMCEQEYGKSLVFFEQTSAPDRQRHTWIECIPVDEAVALETPLYFKQELLQSAQEWHTHRAIIDTSKGGLQQHVPPTFPYFHVEWRTRGARGGYAHVIEDARTFPRAFGRQVVAGMVDVTLSDYQRRSTRSSHDDKRDAELFLTKWQLFDWTPARAEQDVS